jgi:hypothetical protein
MNGRINSFCFLAVALLTLGAIAGCSDKASSGNRAGTGGIAAQETGGSAGPGIGGSTAAGGAAGSPTTNALGGSTSGSDGAAAMGGVGAGGASGTGGMTGAAGDGSDGSLGDGGTAGSADGGSTADGGSSSSCGDPALMALFPACAATKDEASCTERGGTWRTLASSLGGTCVCPTGDGGCPCSSSSDCLGYCISARIPAVGAGSDYCASFTKFTCSSTRVAPSPDCWCRPESPYSVCYP